MNDHDLKRQLAGKKSAERVVMMEALSAEYGWTPNEIREQDNEEIKRYWQILTLKRRIENNNIKKINAK